MLNNLESKIKLLILSILVVGIFGLVGSLRAINNSVFSVSAWVKPSASVASKAIMGKAEEMRIATDASGHPLCQIKASTWQTAVVSSAVIAVNQWSHIVCSYDRNSFKIFIDGELKGTQALTATADDTSAQWLIGRDASASTPYGYFSGLVDAYKFYNYALSESEIKTLYNGSAVANMGAGTSRNNNGTTVTGENMDYCVPGDTAKCDKPVLELKFDEKQGSTAFDTSGNGNNGSIVGALWDRGKIGNALNFPLNSNYVSLGSSNFFALDEYTISTYVNVPANIPTGQVDILNRRSSGDWSQSNFILNLVNDSGTYPGRIDFAHVTSGDVVEGVVGNTDIRNSGWRFLTVSYDGINQSIYLDGELEKAELAASPETGGIQYLFLNRDATVANSGIPGLKIDEVRIYDYARTPAQIAWDYNRGKPINEWRFDEGVGTVVHDQGPNRNNGTITGAVWKSGNECSKGSVQGSAEEKCLYFDGLDQTRVNVDTLDNMREFTACVWMKAKSLVNLDNDEVMTVLNKGFNLNVYNDGKIKFERFTSNTYPFITTNEGIVPNNWYRICSVYYGVGIANPKIYLNGINKEGASWYGTGIELDDSIESLSVGSFSNDYAYNFNGYIDDPKIYNYALTAEQIKLDYNGGAVGFR